MSSDDTGVDTEHRRLLKRRYRDLGIPPLAFVWPISDTVHAFETEDGRLGWINFQTLEHGWAKLQVA